MSFRFESMIIEVRAPHVAVNESLLTPAKEKVLSFSHILKDIVKAEIILREDEQAVHENKICEIRLTLYGDCLFVHRRAINFADATRLALEDLEVKVKEQVRLQQDLPDQITSTVRV